MTQLGAKLCVFQVIKMMMMMMMMTMVMMMIDYTKAETRKLLRKSDHTVDGQSHTSNAIQITEQPSFGPAIWLLLQT